MRAAPPGGSPGSLDHSGLCWEGQKTCIHVPDAWVWATRLEFLMSDTHPRAPSGEAILRACLSQPAEVRGPLAEPWSCYRGPLSCWSQNLDPQNLSLGVAVTPVPGEGPPFCPACAQVGLITCPGRPAVSPAGWGLGGAGPLPPATEARVLRSCDRSPWHQQPGCL